jgi:hypothetical protein
MLRIALSLFEGVLRVSREQGLMKFLNLIFLTICVHRLNAQTPGTRLVVDVKVRSLAVQGDTMTVTYTLYNRPTSRDSLYTFTVDAPARVKSILTPQPQTKYDADSIYRGRSVADWAFLSLLPPGAVSVALTFQSVGVPAIVSDWAGGNYPLVEENAADSTYSDPLKYRTVPGKTVGVEPWPIDRTPMALIARLRSLTRTSCAAPLNWITAASLCSRLIASLDQAETNRASGNVSKAKSAVATYIKLLSGTTVGAFATGVTNPAYWLLKPNAEIVATSLR